MARMGHDGPRAALIYQHATSEADQAIAKRINAAVKRQRSRRRTDARDDQADAPELAPVDER